MKKIFTIITIFIAITIAFTACNKEEFNSEKNTTENSENPQDYKEGEYIECKVGVDLSNGVTVDEEEMWGCGTLVYGDIVGIQIRENNSKGKVIASTLIFGNYIDKIGKVKLKIGNKYYIEATALKDAIGNYAEITRSGDYYEAPFYQTRSNNPENWAENKKGFTDLSAQTYSRSNAFCRGDRFYYCETITANSSQINIKMKRVSFKVNMSGINGLSSYHSPYYFISKNSDNSNETEYKYSIENKVYTCPNIKAAYAGNNFRLYYRGMIKAYHKSGTSAFVEVDDNTRYFYTKRYSYINPGSTFTKDFKFSAKNLPFKTYPSLGLEDEYSGSIIAYYIGMTPSYRQYNGGGIQFYKNGNYIRPRTSEHIAYHFRYTFEKNDVIYATVKCPYSEDGQTIKYKTENVEY